MAIIAKKIDEGWLKNYIVGKLPTVPIMRVNGGKIANTNYASYTLYHNHNQHTRGISDLIIFLPNGTVEFWELKSSQGKITQEQKAIELLLTITGHTYIVVNVDNVKFHCDRIKAMINGHK